MKKKFSNTIDKIRNKAKYLTDSLNYIVKDDVIRQLSLEHYVHNIVQSVNNLLTCLSLVAKSLKQLDNLSQEQRVEDLRIIRHDLRSPINGIQGYSEMIVDSLNDNNQTSLIDEFQSILITCKNLLAYIDTLNDSSDKPLAVTDTNSDNNIQAESAKNGHTILVVDDVELNRNLLQDWLSAKGYIVLTADNGHEAINLLDNRSVDIILLDMIMPQMNGFEFLDYVKLHKNFFDIPIIIISALNDMDKIARCIQTGAEDYLIKPFNSFLLQARIDACIEKKKLRNQEKKFTQSILDEKNYIDSLITSMNNMLIVTDIDLIIQDINPSVIEVLGIDDFVGKSLQTIFADSTICNDLKKSIFIHKQQRNLEVDFKTTLGIEAPVLLSYTHLRNNKDELKNIIFVAQDIHEIKNVQSQVKKAYSLIKTTIESTKDGIITIDNNMNILQFNKRFIDIWSIKSHKLKNKNFKDFIKFLTNQLDNSEFQLRKFNTVFKNIKEEMTDVWYLRNDKVIEIYTQPQILEQNTIGRIFCFRDITEHHKLEQQLVFQANHDSLTGLYNRNYLISHIETHFDHVKRNNLLMGVVLLDIDYFKTINDTLGHDTGDQLLQEVSKRLMSIMASSDIITRLGGDEFVICITAENQDSIIETIKTIQRTIGQQFTINNHFLNVTMSLGISLYPQDGVQLSQLLKKADVALYNVKESGRNNFQIYNARLDETSSIQSQLNHDFKNIDFDKEFELHYQPIIDIRNNHIEAAEILLRWQHPQLGMLFPNVFLPIAEKMDLIKSIDQWVLKKACQQSVEWTHKGLLVPRIMVNISSFQVKNYAYLEDIIKHTIQETGIDPQLIGLELTEDNLISNNHLLIKTLKNLKQVGILLSIDDFGTGYSNLNYITNFPIDIIKIDKMFFKDIYQDFKNKTIVNAIAQMASVLNIKIIAEGIENDKQLAYLKTYHDNQINLIQGYFFYRPLAAIDFEKVLKAKVID